MKYLKLYENITELKNLIEHLSKMFSDIGVRCSTIYNEYNKIKEYTLRCRSINLITDEYGCSRFQDLFEIELTQNIDYSTTSYIISIKIIYDYDSLSNFVIDYFKGIEGLTIIDDFIKFSRYIINEDINILIKKISKNDFELKYNTNKFNI